MAEEKEIATSGETEEVEKEENIMEQVVRDPNAKLVTVTKLLEAGAHYGHPTRKRNPKMKPYIYCAKNGIYIIDLVKTKAAIETAYEKLKEVVTDGGKVLFVGTKDNAKEVIKSEAERSGSFYINNRWLGGTLTNFKTIQTRIKKLKDLEAEETDGEWDSLPKKEASKLRKLKEKLSTNLEGIKEMRKLPNILVVVDPTSEKIAVLEAIKLGIPVIALCDTNCDPDGINYVIGCNDDGDKCVYLILQILNDAVVEAKGGLPEVAYAKEDGEEATMTDVLRQADRENALRLAARREIQREKAEKEKLRKQQFESRRRPNDDTSKVSSEESDASSSDEE